MDLEFSTMSGESVRSASTTGSLRHLGSFNYKKITIFKEQLLGRGSFGAVYKAKCDDLPCAAKVLHPTLVDPMDMGVDRVRQRFREECKLLNGIQHPNIVMYLGVYDDPVTRELALLMELLDESLTDMLESLTNTPPYHIQVNICHDVSLAVAYLHSQDIIHRDLSGNNVLMIARRKAKVTDFGVSRNVDLEHHSSTPMSLCPGTKVYMPPEALKEPPVYSEKIDVFSLGVIVLQLLTRLFPRPSSLTQEVHDRDSEGRRLQAIVSERDRRKSHIDLIEPNHPLRETILACLNDEGYERPAASQLCQTFAHLKHSLAYEESRQKDHLIDASPRTSTSSTFGTNGTSESSELKKKLYEKEKQLSKMNLHLSRQDDTSKLHLLEIEKKKKEMAKCAQKMHELQHEKETLAANLQEKENELQCNRSETQKLQLQIWQNREESAKARQQDSLHFERVIEEQRRQIMEKDTEIQQLQERLRVTDRGRADFQRTLPTMHQQRASSSTGSSPTSSSSTPSSPMASLPQSLGWRSSSLDKLDVQWRDIDSTPSSLCRGTSAYHNGTVYLAYRSKVFSYSTTSLCWKELPNSPQANGGFVMINEFPTMIGGERGGHVTNSLVSLMDYTSWIESFPKMPTARAYPSAVMSNNHVIVIGGSSSTRPGEYEDINVLSVVEVMEISEMECLWFSVSSLCHPLADASTVIYQGQIMLIGGTDCYGKTLINLKCSIQELLNTKTKNAINGYQEQPTTRNRSSSSPVWKRLTDSRLWHSTGVVVKGQLLAIGGTSSNGKNTTYMFRYNDTSNLWEQVGLMKVARSLCYAVSLPNNELMVVGGNCSNPSTLANLAIIATIL